MIHLLLLIGWVYERMKIWIWWLDGLMPLRCLNVVYTTLSFSIIRFPFISIFCRYSYTEDHQYVAGYGKERPVLLLPLIFTSSLFALFSWIKHYHTNDVITKLFAFFGSRRSSYFDSACIALFMMVRFAHAPCGTFCLNYKLLVKYELQIWYNRKRGRRNKSVWKLCNELSLH